MNNTYNDLHITTDQLLVSEASLKEENLLLQKRLKEYIDANKEVTVNYQTVKKNLETKKREVEELVLEIDEVKNACQLAMKQKNAAVSELTTCKKQKQELQERSKVLEVSITRKEKEILDLNNKINDTIATYEVKLERKEEQIWSLNSQINEGTLV